MSTYLDGDFAVVKIHDNDIAELLGLGVTVIADDCFRMGNLRCAIMDYSGVKVRTLTFLRGSGWDV